MNRRNFFAFLPLAPIVAAGSVNAEAKPDISAGAPIPEATRITFSGNKKKEFKPYASGGSGGLFNIESSNWSILTMSETDHTKNVDMAVGDDGNLWLRRKDGEWKRIVTE